MTWVARWLAVVFAVAVLAACGSSDPESSPGRPMNESPSEASSPQPSSTDSPASSGPATYAVQDLAERLGIDEDDIRVVSVDEVTWRDGSIGCPEPGMMYTQALVNGTLIVLRAGDREYEYHSGGTRKPFYCENPRPPLE